MRLKRDANETDLKTAASLEAWSTAEALVKLSPAQRSYFLRELAAAAILLAGKYTEKVVAIKVPRRCLKTSHHTHHGQPFENDRKHDTKGMPWPKRTKRAS